MGKGQSSQQMKLGKLDFHLQKNGIELLSYIVYKNSLKMGLRPKTIKLVGENIGGNLWNRQ